MSNSDSFMFFASADVDEFSTVIDFGFGFCWGEHHRCIVGVAFLDMENSFVYVEVIAFGDVR